MNRVILAAASPGEVRVAVLCDGELEDIALWRPGAPDGVGDLHLGRVVARVPAMGGAFVAIAGAEGFLPDQHGAPNLTNGQILAVRVVRAAQGGKGPRLAAALAETPTSHAPCLLHRGPDPLRRFAARWPGAPIHVTSTALAARLHADLADRVTLIPDGWTESLANDWDELTEPVAELPGGMRMSVYPTPALVAIDLDGGSSTAVAAGKASAQMAANLAALPALARQIRLRNLSGAILVDLAGLPARKRAALRPALEQALAPDPLRPRLLGFTALGLAEIVRPRVHPPLHEWLAGPHAAGLAALRAIAQMVAADPAHLPILRAAPAMVAALQDDRAALADLAALAGRSLVLRSDPNFPANGWRLDQPA